MPRKLERRRGTGLEVEERRSLPSGHGRCPHPIPLGERASADGSIWGLILSSMTPELNVRVTLSMACIVALLGYRGMAISVHPAATPKKPPDTNRRETRLPA